MKFLASDLTVREQSWRRGRSLYECWVRLGRRWWRTCWGLTRMFSNRVSMASSASCDAVGSVSWYRLSRTARRTCASIWPLSDEVAKPHQAGEPLHRWINHYYPWRMASATPDLRLPFQSKLVLIAPTHGGMARLSWPGWLVTYRDS